MAQWPDMVTHQQMAARIGPSLGPKVEMVMVSRDDGYRFYKRESDGLWYRLEGGADGGDDSGRDA